jgi:hypothetical protein
MSALQKQVEAQSQAMAKMEEMLKALQSKQ